jgi:protein-S-isoprenylcysteine O-methyltransferase Ste14
MVVILLLSSLGFVLFQHRAIHGIALYGDDRGLTAITLFTVSLAVFWWSVSATRSSKRLTLAFTPDKPAFLIDSGPYSRVRHPFYTSYLLFWAGAALVGADASSYAIAIVISLCFVAAARMEESKFMRSALAADYAVYRRQTGMFLPRLSLPRKAASPLS